MHRLACLAASALVLAACDPSKSSPAPSPTPAAEVADDESGSDEPGAPFNPAPPGPPRSYEAVSKTAMALTGRLTVTPTAQTSPNMPPGAIFAFERGFSYSTTSMPGGATQGTPAFDWSKVFPGANPETIEMYTVEEAQPPGGTAAAGLCDHLNMIATVTTGTGATQLFQVAGIADDQWPPRDPDTAICGTFGYAPPEDPQK